MLAVVVVVVVVLLLAALAAAAAADIKVGLLTLPPATLLDVLLTPLLGICVILVDDDGAEAFAWSTAFALNGGLVRSLLLPIWMVLLPFVEDEEDAVEAAL